MPKTTASKKTAYSGPCEYNAARDAQARDRLIQARVAMLIKHDFWGKMATRMRLINADAWCHTLATDGKNFYYNSEFVLGLGSIDKVIFGFAHEVLHCIYDHIPRTGDRNRKLSNIAQDYVINADLVHYGVGKAIDEIEIIYDKKYFNWSFEAVYEELLKNADKIDIDKLFEMLLDDHLEASEDNGDGDGADGNGDGGDVSKKRPKFTKAQREAIKDEIREAVLQAAQGSNAGNLPGGIQRIINNLTNPKMDWRSLINMKIPSLAKNDYSYQRFNKKYMQSGIIVPGLNREEAIDVCIAIDTSGSISQKVLEEQLGEVLGIMDMYEEFTIRIWQFDTGIYGYAEFTKDTAGDIINYEVKGGGGTDFDANWKFMKEEGIEPQMFIVFTDGEPFGSWGDENYTDTLWIINNKYNKSIVPPFGTYAYYE
jgi:predicted metal-dependent peptidase